MGNCLESERALGRVSNAWAGLLVLACLGSLVLAGAIRADQGPAAGAANAVVLFDGKSLGGWKKTDFFGDAVVKVEDSAIVMSVGRPMSGITTDRKDLPKNDYELSYEAMRISGGDFFAAATFPVGQGYLTLVNGGWGGSVTGLSSLDGMDASENETTRSMKYQEKTWYRFRIRVTAGAIRCWIDDKEMIAVNPEGRRLSTRLEVRANQPLGFATWETSGALRKITIRKLTPAEIAANRLPVDPDRD